MCGSGHKDIQTQAKSWVVHTFGEIAILAARGPEKYIYGHSHRLFIDGRLHLVSYTSQDVTYKTSNSLTLKSILAVHARKKSILGEHRWKSIPWSHYRKTPKDKLLDIFVDIRVY